MFLLGLSLGATVWKQTWSLFECFAWLLEFACVEIGRRRRSSRPSHDGLGLTIGFTSDLEYGALLSSVGSVGTLLVSGGQDYH